MKTIFDMNWKERWIVYPIFILVFILGIFLFSLIKVEAISVLFADEAHCCFYSTQLLYPGDRGLNHVTSTIPEGGIITGVAGRIQGCCGLRPSNMFYVITDENNVVLATSTIFNMDSDTETSCSILGFGGTGGCRKVNLNTPLTVSGNQQLKLWTELVSKSGDGFYTSIYNTAYYEGNPIPISNISITLPMATTTKDFNFWNVNVSASQNLTEGYIKMNYGANVALLPYTSDRFPLVTNSFFSTTTTAVSFPKTTALGFGTWYAQATFFSKTSQILATSSIISWTLSVPPAYPFYTTSTAPIILFPIAICSGADFFSSSSIANITCQAGNAVKGIANDIFGAVSNGIYTLTTMIKNTFPLNIFISINSAFEKASMATSTPDIVLAGAGLFGGRSYAILTSSTIPNISNKHGFDWRAFFSKIMYAVTGLLIIGQTISVIQHLKKDKQENA